MKRPQIPAAILLMLSAVSVCFADLTVQARSEAEVTHVLAPQAASDQSANVEIFRNVFVAAGKSVSIDSRLDYSSAGTVAVTVLCTNCNSLATSLGSAGLVLQARWLFPNADSDVATDYRSATNFSYWDAGGVLFDVFGPKFRLTLQNKSSLPLAVQQVTIFRRGQ